MNWVKDKLLSRKFLVVVATVGAAVAGVVTWDQAVQVVLAWVVGQSVVDTASALKGNTNEGQK